MSKDFNADTCEIFIDNFKRRELIGNVVSRSYLDTFPELEKINVVVNHPSVTIDDFPEDIRDRIKIWKNDFRHPLARGPISQNYNGALLHTFLTMKKKYLIYAHDSYVVSKNWKECIENSDYNFYSAPLGDSLIVMTLEGLRTFGYMDPCYLTMGWHEISYLTEILRKSHFLKQGKASIIDHHGLWPNELSFVHQHHLHYNSVGLENYVQRFSMNEVPQIGERSNLEFTQRAEKYHKLKWRHPFDKINGYSEGEGTLENLIEGPLLESLDPFPWFDVKTLRTDRLGY